MSNFLDYVYETVTGQLLEEREIPGAENVFAAGTPCDTLYEQVSGADLRLRDRLGHPEDEEDTDVRIIIDRLLDICQIVGYEMYRCGALFGRGEAFVRRENIHSALPPIAYGCGVEDCRKLLEQRKRFREDLERDGWTALIPESRKEIPSEDACSE